VAADEDDTVAPATADAFARSALPLPVENSSFLSAFFAPVGAGVAAFVEVGVVVRAVVRGVVGRDGVVGFMKDLVWELVECRRTAPVFSDGFETMDFTKRRCSVGHASAITAF